MSWYILSDREFCSLYIDAVHVFQILIFLPLFSLLLYDVVKRFSGKFPWEFKLNQNTAEPARKLNQTFGNDSVNERTVRRWFAKFCSRDFSLEDESDVVDLQQSRTRI